MDFTSKTELQALEELEALKPHYDWDDDNKAYKERKKIILDHYQGQYKEYGKAKKKEKNDENQGRIYVWDSQPHKVVKANTFDDAKAKHGELMEGSWHSDRPGGGILKNYGSKKGVKLHWKRFYCVSKNGSVAGWRAIHVSKGNFHYQEGVPKVKEEDEQADEEGEEEAEDEDDGAPEEVAQVAPVPVPAAKGAKKKQQQGATADEDGGEQSVEDPSVIGKPSGKRQRRAPAK